MASGTPQEESFIRLPDGMGDDPGASFSPQKTRILSPPQTNQNNSVGEAETSATLGASSLEAPKGPAFELVKVLGQGGFGIVWEGIQRSLRRVVAIKMVRNEIFRVAAMSPDQGKALTNSFRAEALTSAQLDHPNIVPMYELGTDEFGLPLLAMKLVDGKSWESLINEDFILLSVDDFLAKHIPILLDVTQAVAFAHSRGIVHRDLKPSQVMVGDYGEVLLMDWGLAIIYDETLLQLSGHSISLEGAPTNKTAGNPAGTPAYMAPEQTDDTAENIGPWTDVYLLGGSLFTVLTGASPHAGHGSMIVMAKAKKGEIANPTEQAPGRTMPEELLVLMYEALKADFRERKLTARQFAERLRDYLSGAGKRHESESIVRDVAARLGSNSREYEELSRCISDLGRASALWSGNPSVKALRQEALVTFGHAALANGDFVLARVQAKRLDPGTPRDNLMSDIDAAEDRAKAQARTRQIAVATVIALIAVIAIGAIIFNRRLKHEVTAKEAARTQAEEARKRAELARAESEDLVGFMLGDLKEKLEPVGRLDVMDAVLERVGSHLMTEGDKTSFAEQSQRAKSYLAVSEVRLAQGRAKDAAEAADRALMTANSYRGRTIDGTDMAGLAMEAHVRKSDALARLGQQDNARAEAEHAVAVVGPYKGDTQPVSQLHWLAEAYNRQELFLADQGKLDEAIAANKAGRELFDVLADGEPSNRAWRRELAVNRNNLGNIYKKQGKGEEMRSCYEEALAIRLKLAEEEPTNPEFQRDLSASHLNLGFLLASGGKFDDAAVEIEKALAIHERLAESDSANLIWLSELAVICNHLANVDRAGGNLDAARKHYERAVALGERLTASRPNNDGWQFDLALTRLGYGLVLRALGEDTAANASVEKSVATLQRLTKSDPTNAQWQRALEKALAASQKLSEAGK